jgi:hypothetical protein
MNGSDTEGKNGSHAAVSSSTNTRLTGALLAMARLVWAVLVVPSLGLFVISLPVYDQLLQRGCVALVTCGNLPGALTTPGLQALAASSLSLSAYAAFFTIFFALITAIWCTVGLLLFWRRSDDWFVLLTAFFLVLATIVPTPSNPTYALAETSASFALPFSLLNFLAWVSLFGFGLLFPNGRLVPRPMGLILLLGIIYEGFNNFPSLTSPFDAQWPAGLSLLVFAALLLAILASHIYRYRRVSTPLQRQQTKWVIFAITAIVVVQIVICVADLLVPSFQNPHTLGDVIGGVVLTLSYNVVLLLAPLSLGFSILRYRLYDIDVLINRTLVYGSLTALLALLYFGLIFALQALFQGLLHQNNAVALVISTLVIAALFQPLRRRIQNSIDRRFYRRKYDAARVVAVFNNTLRQGWTWISCANTY